VSFKQVYSSAVKPAMLEEERRDLRRFVGNSWIIDTL